MRIDKFAEPGDIDPNELGTSIYFDLAEGADPEGMVRFLTERVELSLDQAQELVGSENARLQETMHWIAEAIHMKGERPAALVEWLNDRDWPRALAEQFVARVQLELAQLAQDPAGREQLIAKSRRGMSSGLLWFAGGAFATWFTGYAARQGYGEYQLLAFGPVLFGIAQFGYSAYRWGRFKLGSG